jgi:8-oxo-dGTP pyrophosphatase MutT (NUDIX family)
MIERHRDAVFPGALVFPGGVVDDGDRRPGDPPGMAFRRAAIRETFEEVGLTVAGTDLLVPFAHWVTPERSPKRYDTFFFLARAPLDQIHRHDGHEAVDSLWIAPDAAIAEDAAKRRRLVFATRLNLMRLARFADAAAALAEAAASTHLIAPICPEVYDTPEGTRIRIPSSGHYDATDFPTPDQRRG